VPVDHTEKAFEAEIERHLVEAHGYVSRRPDQYDRALCLDAELLTDFVKATQPEEWARHKRHHGGAAREALARRVAHEVAKRGVLDVLRRGVKDVGCRFTLCHFKPASRLNPDLQDLYRANAFSIVRQLKYSQKNESSIDLVLFLNGLPLFTAELKDPLTRQTVQNAIRQYKLDRDPREELLKAGRCLAHFAVDPDLVYFTTVLDRSATRFMPFNRGHAGGAGNPPSATSYATAYLWRSANGPEGPHAAIWSPDSVLNLVERFVEFFSEKEDGKTVKRVIFPRYHQLTTVRSLIADARASGAGKRYLIQHSAGSGKSNSIAWLAHQLSVLHDDRDERVFDSIVIITDRRVLDRQLQTTVKQFEQTLGVVENIDKTSRQLKEALEAGKQIIVTTLQKFPVIADEIAAMPGERFAVIVDEAHSSQSGESTKSLKKVLAAGSLEEAAAEDEADAGEEWGGGDEVEDLIAAAMLSRQRPDNVSYLAFTATPKAKTLELFGTRMADGSFKPFSLYTMRQAIEEGFILDVLANYTTYSAYWHLRKRIADDPRYDRKKAEYLLKQYVELHPHSVKEKVGVMLDHFTAHVAGAIKGRAKAMVVTRSRLHAVRYKLEIDRALAERRLPFECLVAFSGTVRDGGKDFTEQGMNGVPETQTAGIFGGDDFRIMVCAYKFQTGFDQPLLHTMYVDKKLGGVGAVQTLSRLNRICPPSKTETMVLDFENEADEIKAAFEPFYEATILSEGTDPNVLYDKETALRGFGLFADAEVDTFAALFFSKDATQGELHALLDPIVGRFREAEDDVQRDFRKTLRDFVRLYAFVSQVIDFVDTDLEKLYQSGRFLLRKLPLLDSPLPYEVQQAIDMESYRLEETGSRAIALDRRNVEVKPPTAEGRDEPVEEREQLSEIIRELNEMFGTEFTDDDRVFIEQLEERLDGHPSLESIVRDNPPENAILSFEHFVSDEVQNLIETNFSFYRRITDDDHFAQFFFSKLFDRFRERLGE
jgi:type I restriction enzyme R subunit